MSRSKNQGTISTFINSKAVDIVPYLLFGSVSVIFGIGIYYGLPLALLELNFGLILIIFFTILIGLLLGLVLVSVNLQGALEKLLLYVLLFWETKSMKILIQKNQTAHKKKNKLTSIIYALTLGCIIFLLTSANLQVETISQFSLDGDADIIIYGHDVTVDEAEDELTTSDLKASQVDAVLYQYKD